MADRVGGLSQKNFEVADHSYGGSVLSTGKAFRGSLSEALSSIHRRIAGRGQGMVEFAIIIPVALTLMLGILEFGRLMIIYIDVNSASREAARYGAAIGNNGSGVLYYRDCTGIRNAAIRVGQIAGVNSSEITITYNNIFYLGNSDAGTPPQTIAAVDCATIAGAATGTYFPTKGTSIVVGITVPFHPLILGAGILPGNISSTAERTFVTDIYVPTVGP